VRINIFFKNDNGIGNLAFFTEPNPSIPLSGNENDLAAALRPL